MNKEYTVEYEDDKQKVFDIMNKLETFVFIGISLFNHKIRNIRIIENSFLNEEMLDYEESIC